MPDAALAVGKAYVETGCVTEMSTLGGFACVYLTVPALFVKKTIILPLYHLYSFVKDQLTISIWVHF